MPMMNTPMHSSGSSWMYGDPLYGMSLRGLQLGQNSSGSGDPFTQRQEELLDEQIKTLRQNRVWGAVTAVAAVGSLVIALIAMRSRRG